MMAELRFDPAADEWVIMAHERIGRPSDFEVHQKHKPAPSWVDDCPFCPGNESLTPPELAVYCKNEDTSKWQVRVIPNKFPALNPGISAEKRFVDKYFEGVEGIGHHEVVVESPIHNEKISEMDPSDVELILKAYIDRVRVLSEREYVKSVVIFKNHGPSAGTSILHPHSQIIATPTLTNQMRKRLQVAVEYYSRMKNCLYCDINKWEHESGRRIIYEGKYFIVFNPYASHYSYETWISPIEHSSCFSNINRGGVEELSGVLPDILRRIESILGNPDYNYILHTALNRCNGDWPLHWYIQIVPRISVIGGFEIGSGTYINPTLPEDAAKSMRTYYQLKIAD
ncbi:galactose-1-phosphate uridylyltransferase [Candidatus Bathyarchaeota archaeon]|nr:galactose-1-phosphate uridylyltransferase [Candidatus Bathyarchaeota archaeon]